MNILIYALGIIGTIALAIFGVLYSSNKIAAIWILCFGCVCYLVLFFTFLHKSIISISVYPSKRYISPGINEKFILKLTNNQDIPLYQLNLRIRVEKGDLEIDNIKIDLREEPKLQSDLGKVAISHDMFGLVLIDKQGRKEKHNIIYDIDPRSLKELIVDVHAEKITEKSVVTFKVTRFSKEPTKIISGKNLFKKASGKDDFDSLYEKGKILINQKKYSEAIECLKKAIELKPNSAKAHNNLGNAYHFIGNNALAADEYQKAIRIDPNLAQPHFNWGVMLMNEALWTEAIKQFEISSQLNHPAINYDSYVAWGICLKRLNRHEEAFEKYQQSIDLKPDLAPAYLQWGVDLLHLKKYEDSILKFEIVSKLDDTSRLDALGLWGVALEGLGNFDEALAKYNEVIKLAPDSKQADKSRNSIRELNEKKKNN